MRTTGGIAVPRTESRSPGVVIVMAIAGLLLMGAVPAAAQDVTPDPASAVVVTGTQGGCYLLEAGWEAGGPDQLPYTSRRSTVSCGDKADDPRVTGRLTVTLDADHWTDVGTGVQWLEWALQGPEGTWTGRGYGVLDAAGNQLAFQAGTGTEAYAGLTYAWVVNFDPNGIGSISGVIYPGSPPPGFPVGPLPETTPPPASD